jgi:hypothetical protein
MLDPALRRPGRLDREVEVGVPDQQGRAEVCVQLIKYVKHISCVLCAAVVICIQVAAAILSYRLRGCLAVQHRTVPNNYMQIYVCKCNLHKRDELCKGYCTSHNPTCLRVV